MVGEFAPACHTEFGEDRLEVVLRDIRGDVQAHGDLPRATSSLVPHWVCPRSLAARFRPGQRAG